MKMYAEVEYRDGLRCQFCGGLTELYIIKGRDDNLVLCKDCAEKIMNVVADEILEIEEE